jgi:hypothetical protein
MYTINCAITRITIESNTGCFSECRQLSVLYFSILLHSLTLNVCSLVRRCNNKVLLHRRTKEQTFRAVKWLWLLNTSCVAVGMMPIRVMNISNDIDVDMTVRNANVYPVLVRCSCYFRVWQKRAGFLIAGWNFIIYRILILPAALDPGVYSASIMYLGSKVRLVFGTDNLTAIYEPIVCTMWDPYHLTTL